ncbi:sigma-54 interaction domain-containing protein [Plebeiibacterium sediminum]|uniref:Sigma 54-interacting transcriptional regulator n=1 Tax=Plebeiibacterium sediminum TaxID=2992112 RepID=A0AAE3SFE6_9BACT|nr:sigma 54-interacting transcriptional regulator [Plebeiobacterium sediminum]MCW3787348.1 sigma 54-interacting transcriptional regulator [Plebeiobacterium sediminum]
MVTLNAHNITNHIKRFILHELSEIILEPLTIFIFDENQQLLIHHSTDNHKILPDTSAHKTITEVNNEILNKKDFSFYSNQFFIHADLAYHIGILIKGEINTAKTYIHLLTEIISQSIKDIKQQNQLDKTEQFTFAIMNAVNFAVLSTNSSGKIIYANDHCCRILDIRRTELLDYSIEKLIPTWNDIIKMVNQGNDVSNKETTISTPSDSLKFNLNCSPIIDTDGIKIGFVLAFRSIEKVYQLVNKYTGMEARYTFDDIIGKSKIMRQAIDYAETIANSPSTILIEGESGTGKEVFAQSIHNASNRKNGAFVAINCAAISENLIESELFGYEHGAFTGAKKGGHPGKFELANNGTLFLDEIGDMKPDMQVKLLRAIQESSITRVGGDKVIPIDVRIIAATNKNLQNEVEKGNFRMDLFYRISVIPLYIPSLKERKGDIPSLIKFFLNQKSLKLHKDIPHMGYSDLQQLLDYDWPGNVRELENYIEQLVNFNGKISLDSFHILKHEKDKVQYENNNVNIEAIPDLTLQEIEKRHIFMAIKKHSGNMTKVAKILGIGRNTLYQKLKKYNINHSD